MSRFMFNIAFFWSCLAIVMSITLNSETLTEITPVVVTSTPVPDTEDSPYELDEEPDAPDPVKVLLDAAFIIEEDISNDNPTSSDELSHPSIPLDVVSSTPTPLSGGNGLDPLV